MKSDGERRPRGTKNAETIQDVDWLSQFPAEREATNPGMMNHAHRGAVAARKRSPGEGIDWIALNARFTILRFEPFPGDTLDELADIEREQENSRSDPTVERRQTVDRRAKASTLAKVGSISPLTLPRLRATSRVASIGPRLSLLRNSAADFCQQTRLHAQRWELLISKRAQRFRLVLQSTVQDVRVDLRQRRRTVTGWVVMGLVGGIAALALLAVASSSARAPGVRSEPFEMTSRETAVATPSAMQPSSQTISAQRAPQRGSAKPPSADAKPRGTPTKPTDYVGSLFVKSDPSSAVFINRTYVGTTPIELSNLRAGSHVVWLDRDGYDRWSGAILVATGRTTRLGPKLHPTPRP